MASQRPIVSYFRAPALALMAGVAAALYFAGPAMALLVAILAILEISLSFDNAVVNAQILGSWDEKWRKLFLGIGIIVAVAGMRLIFPLGIVSVTAGLSPGAVLDLALHHPADYAAKLISVRYLVAAFGGVFLAKIGLEHFLDAEKETHWISAIESPLAKLGGGVSVEILVTMGTLLAIAHFLPVTQQLGFVVAGVLGLITFLVTKNLGVLAAGGGDVATKVIRAGIGGFLYLEVLDASFSFDGVIGAFAITQNLIWITVGLGIGALTVRELTLMAVDRGTLAEFPHLEHGAFWAILALAGIMLISPIIEVPEIVTGLIGAGLILAAFITSVMENKVSVEVSARADAFSKRLDAVAVTPRLGA
jgi:hypothetical protein